MTRSTQPGWVVGRLLLSGWIVVTSLALISGAHGRPYFVVVGIFSIAVVVLLTLRTVVVLARRRPGAAAPGPNRDPAPFQTRRRTADTPADRLRRHDPLVADQVQVALDLLTGPLVPVLGRDDTSRTHRSIESALAEYGTVDESIDRTVAARTALVGTLTGADIDVQHDADNQQLLDHEADLRRRRSETVARLHRAAIGLQAAWEPVRDQQILRLRHGEISRARDNAEVVAAQAVPGTDASAGLTDAIEEIQGSLDGIREVGGINDRILGDDSFLGQQPMDAPATAAPQPDGAAGKDRA